MNGCRHTTEKPASSSRGDVNRPFCPTEAEAELEEARIARTHASEAATSSACAANAAEADTP
jgi:hypothetical protein